jgi:tetratricopeptide (TPR) repeat protein
MADTNPDVTKLLDEVRREVVEARNMTIRTDNALKSLHAELKTVSGQQDAFARRTWFATGVAYLGFLGLCVAGVLVILATRSSASADEKVRLEKQVADLTAQAEKQKADTAATANAERMAGDIYKQMTTLPGEERLKGIDALAKVDQTKLSPFAKQVLADRAVLLRKEVGAAVFEKGKNAFRRSEWAEAIDMLNRFKAMNPAPEDLLEAQYLLGNASVQSRKYEDGVTHLTAYVDGDKKAKNRDFAMMLLMQAHDSLGHREKGLELAREALSTYPQSEFRRAFYFRVQPAQPQAPAPAAGAAPSGGQ